MWVGGLDKHIDDVLSTSQCININWKDFHFQYSFLLTCWDKGKVDSTGPFSLVPTYIPFIVMILGVGSSLKVSLQETMEALWPLFNCILFLNYKLISGQPRFKVKDMGPDFLMRE